MIIKHKDPRDEDVRELNRILTLSLTAKQKFLVERELKCIKAGEHNEHASAYYLNFSYKDSKNWAVLHDIRLEHRGKVAQIDHILINRLLDVFVLESKNYYYGIKITDNGEFMAWNGKSYQGIESPIEQNKRHIIALRQAIEDRKLSPVRLGIPIPANYISYVMISPTSRIDRPKKTDFDTSMIIKADSMLSILEREVDSRSIAYALKMIGCDTLEDFAKRIARLHRPKATDYMAKFGIDNATTPQPAQPVVAEKMESYAGNARKGNKACQKCGTAVDSKVVFFCNINKQKFGGMVLCRDCQKTV